MFAELQCVEPGHAGIELWDFVAPEAGYPWHLRLTHPVHSFIYSFPEKKKVTVKYRHPLFIHFQFLMITKATFNLEARIKAIRCLSALVIKFTFYHAPLNCTLTFSRHPRGTLRAGGPAWPGSGHCSICPAIALFGCSGAHVERAVS